MKNTNVLKGLECPSCESSGPFEITTACIARVSDDGIEETRDHEWNESSRIDCLDCGYRFTVGKFKKQDDDDTENDE